MYVPKAFAEDRAGVIGAMIDRAAVAHLVTGTDDGLDATTVPLLWVGHLDGASGSLVGHVARANPMWRTADGAEALAIFAGPDAYISPSWYPAKYEHGRVVPTWNYESVLVHGRLTVHDDDAWKLDLVRRLTDHHERDRPERWSVDDAPADFVAKQLRAIVGIELVIGRIEAKRKLSQNRDQADVDGAIAGLESGSPSEHAVADLMRRG
jgi:transcriptional regulator